MKKLLLLCFVSFFSKGFSQDTLVNYLDTRGQITKIAEQASLIQVLIKNDIGIKENLYRLPSKKIISTGHYLDEKLMIKVGQFQYYDEEGALQIVSNFNSKGELHGNYILFNKKKKRRVGVYKDGKMNGAWYYYDLQGQKQARIIYKNNEVYAHTLWDAEGNLKDEPLILEKKLSFKGGTEVLNKVVSEQLLRKFFKAKLKGQALVAFSVNERGVVENVKVKSEFAEQNEQWIKDFFYGLTNWEPAIELNRPVGMGYSMKLIFK